MADQPNQNFQNYTRFDPPYHYVLVPLIVLNLIFHAVDCFRHLSDGGLWRAGGGLVLAVALVLMVFKLRLYPLKVQDRVIRLEERLRLATLLPESLRMRIPELTESQLIALRFASDGEVAELVRATLERGLDSKQIKQAIRTWRGDYFRV